jgi:hypothetical protein
MLEFLKNYSVAIVHYAWLIVFGLPQMVNTAYKWGHPERKDLPIPHWLRISIAIGAVVVAQGFVYHDSLKNLNIVIEEKRKVVSENWHLNHPDNPSGIDKNPSAIKSRPQPSRQTSLPPPNTTTSQSLTTNPSTPPSIASTVQSAPQTWQERVTQVNKNLSKSDRERLSDVLYEFSQMLEKMTILGYKANQEIGQINGGVGDGSIVKDYETHAKKLREISASGKEMARTFLLAREAEKWRYYSEQMNYVFGDNPDNLGPNAIINATEGYANNLDRWSSIKDRENKSALNLLEAPHNESNRFLHTFFDWRGGCETRLEQMKQSIQ